MKAMNVGICIFTRSGLLAGALSACSDHALVKRSAADAAVEPGAAVGRGAIATDGATPDDAGVAVVIPDGGQCGPMLPGAAFLSMMDLPSDSNSGDDGSSCDTEAGVSAFAPWRPLGVGYPDGNDLLPPNTAYLTFDDGPSEWTEQFLDILKTKGVQATFFINAKNFKGAAGLNGTYINDAGVTVVFRDLLKREVDEGHVIANHTVNHPDLAGIPLEQVQTELDDNELLMNVGLVQAGAAPRLLTLFRPPYGSPWYQGQVVPADAAAAQVSIAQEIVVHGLNVMWTIDSSDSREWAQDESFTSTPNAIQPTPGAPTYADKMTRITQTVLGDPSIAQGQGAVILMHDTHDTTRDVLSDIIDGLVAAGYSFGTIEDYVQWRWNRPSIDLTPGPALYSPCVDESHWGCAAIGAPLGTPSHEVCGRMWLAFDALGGAASLGAPLEAAQSPASGIVSQRFQNAVVELHPEYPAPCNVIVIPQ